MVPGDRVFDVIVGSAGVLLVALAAVQWPEFESSARALADESAAHLIAAAEQQAKRLRDDAARQIEAEIERARQELRRSVVEAAVASAETILKRQVRSDDQHRMAERYVRQIEGALQSNKRTS